MSHPFQSIEDYYRVHARIYDRTRWSFLFGRQAIIDRAAALATPATILEVGCGTGKNLLALARTFPDAAITGLDISQDMLAVAHKRLGALERRITLLHQRYDAPLRADPPYDLILFSYCLTMINPGWRHAIDCAVQDIAPGGLVAVADFHNSPVHLFKRWMGVNHVRMDSHLLPALEQRLQPRVCEIRAAYGGLWSYLLFVGAKQPATAAE